MPRRDGGHPPLRWLADRADGTLSAARTARLAAHLATGCAACAARDGSLRATLAALKAGPLPAPPRGLRRAASVLPRAARIRAAAAAVRSLLAELVSDGRLAPALALRTAPGDERRLLWRAGSWEIDVCIVASTRGCDVLGQVVRAESGDGGASGETIRGEVVAQSGSQRRSAPLAADGRFALRGLAASVWAIGVRVDDESIDLPPLAVESGS